MNTKMRMLVTGGILALAIVCYGITNADGDPTIPSATNVSATTAEVTPVAIALQGASNDSGTITFATSSNPADGTLGIISGDSVTYTPNSGFTGTDSFQFLVTEGATSSPAAMATITVSAPTPTGPVISGASDITAEATSSAGAYVSFNPTATDAKDGTDPVVCTPASETLFGFGTTTVSCTSSDSLFGTTTATFGVGVVDTTPPVFTSLPSHMFIATSSFSVMPQSAYPTATDAVDPDPTITYSPTTLPVGTTTVTWTATDASGNSAATTSSVVIVAPLEVDVPASCTVVDTNGVSHTLPDGTTPSGYLGICMLEAAKDAGLIQSFEAEYFAGSGFFIQSINGIEPGTTQYWELWDNEVSSQVGADGISLSQGDILSFVLTDFNTNAESQAIAFQARSLVGSSGNTNNTGGGGGGGGGGISHNSLNISSALGALAYLASQQKPDGSFDSSLYTDWAALALVAGNGGSSLQKIKNYELTASPALSSATDYERHAMALEALGINPYTGTPTNYIAPIIAKFNGVQIADPGEDNGVNAEDNNDIFALLALTSAGYTSSDTVIQKEIAFVLSKQQPDGSWDESPDLTAAIQALGPLVTDPQTAGQVLGAAAGYLASTEKKSDGSWNESIDSTSWVQTAINGIIQAQTPGFTTEAPWTSTGGLYPTDYIAEQQQTDGGVRPLSDPTDARVWSTSYAIVAASGQSWDSLLQPFSKPGSASGAGGGNVSVLSATSTSATSTSATNATSTPPTATSTPLVLSASTTSVIVATTTSAAPPVSPPKKKSIVHPQPTTPTTSAPSKTNADSSGAAQTAAASTAVSGNFFSNLWHAFTSFFARLF